MADPQPQKIPIKNPNIRSIFNSMEYGKSSESVAMSSAWLKRQENICATLNEGKQNSHGKATIVLDATTKQPLVTIYSPKPEDLDKIYSEIKENHQWSKLPGLERSVLLDRLANEIEKNSSLFCQLEISVRGILSNDTKLKSLPLLINYLRYYSSWAAANSSTNNGITCSVISDNIFLAIFGMVLGPALASGFNIILQTEPKITVIASLIIELAENVGIPQGVIRLIPGRIDLNSLTTKVNVLSMFGSLYNEKYQNLECPLTTKLLAMMNSKIPMIVFNTADLDSAVDSVADAIWRCGGILPWSVGTVLVQEDIYDTFANKLKYQVSKVKMSYATDQLADLSYPLLEDGIEQLKLTINKAKSLGIEVYQAHNNSDVFQPTLLIGGRAYNNNVLKEDNNLPVLVIIPFRTSNEAANLANNSRYGFGASVWTENIGLANEITKKLDMGTVWINSHGDFEARATVSPRKQSGIGHFGGAEGFLEYFNTVNGNEDMETSKILNPLNESESSESNKRTDRRIYDSILGKDLHSTVVAAKKGQLTWNKMSIEARYVLLRKVANELAYNKKHLRENLNINEEIIDNWIGMSYGGLKNTNNLGSTSTQNNYDLKCYKEPVGVIALQESNSNLAAICSMLLGNSIIIFNQQPGYLSFYLELYKYFGLFNIPMGVFNVISNCNDNIYKATMVNKELDACIVYECKDLLRSQKIEHLRRYHLCNENWPEIIKYVLKIKNVWSNIGDSVL